MLKILHILSQTELTGSEVYAHILATNQSQQGHEVICVSDEFHLSFPGKLHRFPISTKSSWERMKIRRKLRSLIVDEKVDIIHCHSRAACRIAHGARPKGVAYVSTLHGEQHYSLSKRLFDIYGDTVVAVADAIRDQLVNDLKMAPEKIKVVRNPLAWDLNLQPRAWSKNPSVLIAGRNSGPKGQRLLKLIESEVPKWKENHPNLQINILLGGIPQEEYQKKFPMANWLQHGPGIEKVFESHEIVIGGGRIALEGLSKSCETIAFGEKSIVGWVDADNWNLARSTNFGDMGADEAFDPKTITSHLNKILEHHAANDQKIPRDLKGIETLQVGHFEEYRKQNVLESIQEIYYGNRIAQVCPSLPILMYHKVTEQNSNSKHRIFITRENFEKHLASLRKWGFQNLSFKELSEFWFGNKPLADFPKRPILITFDDGYENNLTHAVPILRKFEMTATLFLLANSRLEYNTWDYGDGEQDRLLNAQQRLEISQSGFTIESHGMNHRRLTECSADEALSEMKESKRILESEFQTQMHCFAYPFGSIDDRLPGFAKQSGYHFAVNTDRGSLRWYDDRFSLFRVNIFPEDGTFDLWRKTRSWYRTRFFKKRGQ